MRLIFSLLLFSSFLNAQEFYIVNSENQIKLVDVNFNVTHVTEIIFSDNDNITDIAWAPPNTLYGITSSQKIIDIDLSNGGYTIIAPIENVIGYASLVYSIDNKLISVGGSDFSLLTFDLNTNSVSNLEYLGVGTPGDATFYKGNLIFPGFPTSDIIGFDGSVAKSIGCADFSGYYGFSNFFTDCDTNLIWAFDSEGRIWQHDLENNIWEEKANLFSETGVVYGSTTVNEYLASACIVENLPEIDCSLGMTQSTLERIQLYPNPARDVVHISGTNFGEELFYSVYTMDGKELESGLVGNHIKTSQFHDGMYFLLLHNASRTVSITKKLAVKH